MQAWHCIAIISITVLLFLYGTFRSEIEERVYDQGVSEIESFPSKQVVQKTKDLNSDDNLSASALIDTPAWSKLEITLISTSKRDAKIHAQSIKGDEFLSFLLNRLKDSPTVRELIFSPFESDFFQENEKSILRSLFTAHSDLEKEEQVKILCRGHSGKSAKLLVSLLMDSYKMALANETMDNPLSGGFKNQVTQIEQLESEILKLKEQISVDETKGSELNVEAIALKSELKLLDQEFEGFKNTLIAVDKIFKEGRPAAEYLKVDDISDYGQIRELHDSIEQLKAMLVNQKLEKPVLKEVEKNIKTNQTLLENEIAKAIENLKSKSIEGLKRRQVLDERLLTLKKEEGLKQGSSSKYKLLDSLEKKLAETFQEYERSFLKWKQGKISFSETLLNQN